MSDKEKSTDPGLSAAERKSRRNREAQEAISDHEKAQKAFAENRERLKAERLLREAKANEADRRLVKLGLKVKAK